MQDTLTRCMYGVENKCMKASFYELVDKNMSGKKVPMSTYEGNVVLMVNVASQWGLTKKNYTQLSSESYDAFRSRGLKVLAFPCNQFGAQEPGKHDKILEFVKKYDANMASKLDFFEKTDVNGMKAREVYTFIKNKLPDDDGTTDVRWNFAKFLIDHEGNPYKRYGVKCEPKDIEEDIEILLKKKEKELSPED